MAGTKQPQHVAMGPRPSHFIVSSVCMVVGGLTKEALDRHTERGKATGLENAFGPSNIRPRWLPRRPRGRRKNRHKGFVSRRRSEMLNETFSNFSELFRGQPKGRLRLLASKRAKGRKFKCQNKIIFIFDPVRRSVPEKITLTIALK